MLCQISIKSLKLNEAQGFSLIEVMIAMAIFLIGFLAIGSMQISAVNSNAHSRLRTEAGMIAAQQAEGLLLLDFNDLKAAVESSVYADHDQGPYTITRPIITPINTDACLEDDGITSRCKIINVEVVWQQKGQTRSVTYSLMAVNM